MKTRPLGKTGLRVSVLGLGCGQLGDERLDEPQAARLIHAACDLGITLFDAARSYGLAEERLGRHLGARRQHAKGPLDAGVVHVLRSSFLENGAGWRAQT